LTVGREHGIVDEEAAVTAWVVHAEHLRSIKNVTCRIKRMRYLLLA
jgi:hypothetical protein